MKSRNLVLAVILVLSQPFESFSQPVVSDYRISKPLVGFKDVQRSYSISENGDIVLYGIGNSGIADSLYSTSSSQGGTSIRLDSGLPLDDTYFSSVLLKQGLVEFSKQQPSGNLARYLVSFDGLSRILIDDKNSTDPYTRGADYLDDAKTAYFLARFDNNINLHGLFKRSLNPLEPRVRVDTQVGNEDGVDLNYRFDSDRSHLVYVTYFNRSKIYSVNLRTGGAPVRLDHNGVEPFSVFFNNNYLISKDGQFVIYRGNDTTLNRPNFFRIGIDGHNRITLTSASSKLQSIDKFELSQDGSRLIFTAVPVGASTARLYSVLLDGTGLVQLNAPLASNGKVFDFLIPEYGSSVIYRANHKSSDKQEYYVAKSNGSGQAMPISGSHEELGAIIFGAENNLLAYKSFDNLNGNVKVAMYSADLLSSRYKEVAVPGDLSIEFAGSFTYAKNDDALLFLARDSQHRLNVYITSATHVDTAQLNRTLPPTHDGDYSSFFAPSIKDFQYAPNRDRLIYLGDVLTVGVDELFAVDLTELELETTSDELCFPIVAKTQGRIATVCL